MKEQDKENRLIKDIEVIVSRILDEMQSPPLAIYLVGGYGRGEGAWLADESGKPIPYNDYDIAVISNNNIPYQRLQIVRQELAKQVGINWVDIDFYSVKEIKSLTPTIHNIDLLYASRQVYGSFNILNDIKKLDASKIGIQDIDTLYRTRMWTLLGSWKGDFHNLTGVEALFFKNQMAKCILAACDMILVKNHAYTTSYRQRAHLAPKLCPQIENFSEMAEWAIKEKLEPSDTPLSKDDMKQLYSKAKYIFLSTFTLSMGNIASLYLDPDKTKKVRFFTFRMKLINLFYTYLLRSEIIRKSSEIFLAQNYVLHSYNNGELQENYVKKSADILKKWGFQYSDSWFDMHYLVANARNNL